MWFAGGLAAISAMTYPSISAFVSVYAKDNQQGKDFLFIFDFQLNFFVFRSCSRYG